MAGEGNRHTCISTNNVKFQFLLLEPSIFTGEWRYLNVDREQAVRDSLDPTASLRLFYLNVSLNSTCVLVDLNKIQQRVPSKLFVFSTCFGAGHKLGTNKFH